MFQVPNFLEQTWALVSAMLAGFLPLIAFVIGIHLAFWLLSYLVALLQEKREHTEETGKINRIIQELKEAGYMIKPPPLKIEKNPLDEDIKYLRKLHYKVVPPKNN